MRRSGSPDVTFRPAQGPSGSTSRWYTTTCTRCGREWSVVDVAWNDLRKLIDATIEAMAPDLPLDQ